MDKGFHSKGCRKKKKTWATAFIEQMCQTQSSVSMCRDIHGANAQYSVYMCFIVMTCVFYFVKAEREI